MWRRQFLCSIFDPLEVFWSELVVDVTDEVLGLIQIFTTKRGQAEHSNLESVECECIRGVGSKYGKMPVDVYDLVVVSYSEDEHLTIQLFHTTIAFAISSPM